MKSEFITISCIILALRLNASGGIPFPSGETILDHDDTSINFDAATQYVLKPGNNLDVKEPTTASEETFLPTTDLEKPTPVSPINQLHKPIPLLPDDTTIPVTEMAIHSLVSVNDSNSASAAEANFAVNEEHLHNVEPNDPPLENKDENNQTFSNEQLVPNVLSVNHTLQNSSVNPTISLPIIPPNSTQPFLPEQTTETQTQSTPEMESKTGDKPTEETHTTVQVANTNQVNNTPPTRNPTLEQSNGQQNVSQNGPKFFRLNPHRPKHPTSTTTTPDPPSSTSTEDEEKLETENPSMTAETAVSASVPPTTLTPVQNITVQNSSRNVPKFVGMDQPTAVPTYITQTTVEQPRPTVEVSTSPVPRIINVMTDTPPAVTMPMPGFNRPCNSYFDCGFRPVANGSRTWLRCVGNFCVCELLGYYKDDEADWDVTWNHQAEACLADFNGPCGYNKGIEIHCNIGYQCVDHVCDKNGRIRTRSEVKPIPPLSSCDDAYRGLNICDTETKHRANLFSLLIFPSLNVFESILNNSLNSIKSLY